MSQDNGCCGGGAAAGQLEWLSFPTLGRAFESDLSWPIALLEQRVQQLHSQMERGPAADRVRARLALPGYRHTLALLEEMRQAKNQLAGEQVPHPKGR